MSDDDKTIRRTPPTTESDHVTIWESVHRVDILWRAFGGLAQIVLNWRLLSPVVAVLVWYFWPRIAAYIQYLGGLGL